VVDTFIATKSCPATWAEPKTAAAQIHEPNFARQGAERDWSARYQGSYRCVSSDATILN
jgi:hypothetical protein